MAEVIEEKKDEKLEELQNNLKEAEEKRTDFVVANGNFIGYVRDNEDFKRLDEKYKKCERELAFHNFWNKKELEPIRNLIEDCKKEVGFVDGDDILQYQLLNKDDKYFFAFAFKHYNGKRYYASDFPLYYDKGWDCVYGYILYDTNGHIYFSKKGFNDQGYTNYVTRGIEEERFMYTLEFIDDEYMYFREKREDGKLYRFVNGEYELVYDFGDSYPDFPPVLWDRKLAIVDGTKLFSIKHKKYISSNKIGYLHTYENNRSGVSYGYSDKIHDKEIDEQQKELISKYLKENNLFLSRKTFEVEYDGDSEEYQTLLFVDMTGHIVSKLYVISSDTYKLEVFDISDETYEEVFKKIEELYTKKLERYVKRKKAAEKAAETREKKMKLLNQKEIFETIKGLVSSDTVEAPKKTLRPKDKEQEDNKE